jgi:hypothetical protein
MGVCETGASVAMVAADAGGTKVAGGEWIPTYGDGGIGGGIGILHWDEDCQVLSKDEVFDPLMRDSVTL